MQIISRVVATLFLNVRTRFQNPYLKDMKGSIDGVYSGSLRGWAQGGDGKPLTVTIKKNGAFVGECLANIPRADLSARGIRDGRYGFSLPVPRDFTVRIGDIVEVADSALPWRKMALRMTRRLVTRPGWRIPFEKGADNQIQGNTHSRWFGKGFSRAAVQIFRRRRACAFDANSTGADASDYDSLATRYGKLAVENQQLRALVASYETEIELNVLQLRQVQGELENWFLKCLDLQARLEAHSHSRSAPNGSMTEAARNETA